MKFLLLGQPDLPSSPHSGGVGISNSTGETNLGVRRKVLLGILQHCQQGRHIYRLEDEEEYSIADKLPKRDTNLKGRGIHAGNAGWSLLEDLQESVRS